MSNVWQPHKRQSLMLRMILAEERLALWAPMGAGKTSATLHALWALKQLGEINRILVVSTKYVAKEVWPPEIEKWRIPFSCAAAIGNAETRLRAVRANATLTTINFENLPWLIETLAPSKKWLWDTVVVDEATKLKGFRLRKSTLRARALARVAHLPKRLIELSGLPAPNGLIDLWGQVWFLDQGQRLGRTFTDFTTRYFRPSFDGFGHLPLENSHERITDAITDVCHSIEDDETEAPIERDVMVELPKNAHTQYKALEKTFFLQLEGGEIEAWNSAALSMKLFQVANGFVYDRDGITHPIHTAKFDALEQIMDEWQEPVIVVYQFKSDLAYLIDHFNARTIKEPGAVEDWNAGRIPLLAVHPQSAGHGLNLQDGGRVAVFLGVPWSPEDYWQPIERIGPRRQRASGHPRPVYVYRIMAKDTLDGRPLERMNTKRSINEILLEAARGAA